MVDVSYRSRPPGPFRSTFAAPVNGLMVTAHTNSTSIGKRSIHQVATAVWKDFKTTNNSMVATGARTLTGMLLVAPAVARSLKFLTPLQWAAKGFGPLPSEFWTPGVQWETLTFGQRAARVGISTATSAALTFVAFEGGVLIGSTINQFLPENVKDDIGGTINEVVNEGGYKELWRHPFGIGM
jgi:hypothetical protein